MQQQFQGKKKTFPRGVTMHAFVTFWRTLWNNRSWLSQKSTPSFEMPIIIINRWSVNCYSNCRTQNQWALHKEGTTQLGKIWEGFPRGYSYNSELQLSLSKNIMAKISNVAGPKIHKNSTVHMCNSTWSCLMHLISHSCHNYSNWKIHGSKAKFCIATGS